VGRVAELAFLNQEVGSSFIAVYPGDFTVEGEMMSEKPGETQGSYPNSAATVSVEDARSYAENLRTMAARLRAMPANYARDADATIFETCAYSLESLIRRCERLAGMPDAWSRQSLDAHMTKLAEVMREIAQVVDGIISGMPEGEREELLRVADVDAPGTM
jgi:hypothetical protein